MNKIPALINEKDVTTDWMESVFDSDDFLRDTRLMIGMINHCAVQATWNDNTITWHISKDLGRGVPVTAYIILEQRLLAWESIEQNIYSKIEHGEIGQYEIIQRFYFKDEES